MLGIFDLLVGVGINPDGRRQIEWDPIRVDIIFRTNLLFPTRFWEFFFYIIILSLYLISSDSSKLVFGHAFWFNSMLPHNPSASHWCFDFLILTILVLLSYVLFFLLISSDEIHPFLYRIQCLRFNLHSATLSTLYALHLWIFLCFFFFFTTFHDNSIRYFTLNKIEA